MSDADCGAPLSYAFSMTLFDIPPISDPDRILRIKAGFEGEHSGSVESRGCSGSMDQDIFPLSLRLVDIELRQNIEIGEI